MKDHAITSSMRLTDGGSLAAMSMSSGLVTPRDHYIRIFIHALIMLALLCLAGLTQAAVVITHQGSTDPITETPAWTTEGNQTYSGLSDPGVTNGCTGNPCSYIRVEDTSTAGGSRRSFQFDHTLTRNDDWQMSARVRRQGADDVADYGALMIGRVVEGTDTYQHIVEFGVTSGDLLIEIGALSTTVSPASDFHLVQIVYDGATQTADILVDGVESSVTLRRKSSAASSPSSVGVRRVPVVPQPATGTR